MTPTNFRAGGAGTKIRFAVGECSLGSVLVAASDRGVCAISLADDPETLVRELQDRFPRAQLIGGDAEFEASVAKVVGYVDNPARGLDLPLDIRGTAFQLRVWQALREIPAGSTASYTEVAKRIGAPKSARAVARACAANVLAIAIPCHRVVRTDGSCPVTVGGSSASGHCSRKSLRRKERCAQESIRLFRLFHLHNLLEQIEHRRHVGVLGIGDVEISFAPACMRLTVPACPWEYRCAASWGHLRRRDPDIFAGRSGRAGRETN